MPWMRRPLLFLLTPMLLVAQGNIIVPRQGVPPSAPPANTPPEQRCVVQGHVVDSQTGEPLKKATVRLARTRVGGRAIPGPRKRTAASGSKPWSPAITC